MNRRPSLPPSLVLAAPGTPALPPVVQAWLASLRGVIVSVRTDDELMAVALRTRPRVAVVDARWGLEQALAACRRLKADSFTGIVPMLVLVASEADVAPALDAGADEVLSHSIPLETVGARLRALIRRSDRDVGVHPSTRLPGAVELEAEIARRLERGEAFAVCYADLDHFKEFNDRYGYNNGDRIIRLLARILHDVVKGICGERGFVGHIGGDDFLYVVPLECMETTCEEIIAVFDLLVPLQYSEQDRRAGYFFGKDRRGRLHRVPLMTISIGVVTTARRRFVEAAQVSALATEMKSYAKTLPGSVYSVDRRMDASMAGEGAESNEDDRDTEGRDGVPAAAPVASARVERAQGTEKGEAGVAPAREGSEASGAAVHGPPVGAQPGEE